MDVGSTIIWADVPNWGGGESQENEQMSHVFVMRSNMPVFAAVSHSFILIVKQCDQLPVLPPP